MGLINASILYATPATVKKAKKGLECVIGRDVWDA